MATAAPLDEERPSKRARAEEEPAPTSAAPAPGSPVPVTTNDLQPGERVEVKWRIAESEEDDAAWVTKWWGATVTKVEAASEDGTTTCTLRYDAHESFEEEEVVAIVEQQGWLRHSSEKELLRWKREGEAGGQEASSDEEGEDEEMDPDALVGMAELTEEADAVERQLGAPLDQVLLSHMATTLNLPMNAQQHIAAGFRDFSDHLRSKLMERLAKNGGEYTVTPDDIREMVKPFQATQ